jgi:hypothetical protein
MTNRKTLLGYLYLVTSEKHEEENFRQFVNRKAGEKELSVYLL